MSLSVLLFGAFSLEIDNLEHYLTSWRYLKAGADTGIHSEDVKF